MKIQFPGRILFLSENADIITRQLNGENFTLAEAGALRDNVSTDEITPAWTCYYFDERLGEYPYVGLKCDGQLPVSPGAVKASGFRVTVAGKRYGKGSSREASPYAESVAGIRLVIAESFERIYRQNCHNLGIFTSTDFSLVERVRNGEAIPLEELVRDLDPITAEVVSRGGLFAYTKARLAGEIKLIPVDGVRPMTYAEKILARGGMRPTNPDTATEALASSSQLATGQGVFVKVDWRYSHDYCTPMSATFLKQAMGNEAKIHQLESVVCFADHLTYVHRSMPQERRAMGLLDAAQYLGFVQEQFCKKYGIQLHGVLPDRDGSEGICHSIMTERYVLPGQIAIGTDSHTTHCGALGCLAFGVGATDMANAWVTGDVRISVPKIYRILLDGVLKPGVDAKDIVLYLLQMPKIRSGGAIGQIIEYSGPVVQSLGTDARATLTNMVAEIGGMTGIIVPDQETIRFLRERRNVDFKLEPWMCSDEGARYDDSLVVDCSMIEPMTARPGDPGRGMPVSAVPEPVKIDIAYGGSCTGGKREDFIAYHSVLKWGLERGMKIADGVEFFLQFGSQDVRDYCAEEKMLILFERAGVHLIEPGCGACINAGPGVSREAGQVTVSAINRNFPGRSGPGDVWLASPETVAASALAGKIISFGQLQMERGQVGDVNLTSRSNEKAGR